MCGIAGVFFKKDVNQEKLNRFEYLVKEKQYKRGPDEFNSSQIIPNLFFFQNMLSIIDIGNAQQPMHDEKGVITYNGEIYNFKELKYQNEHYFKKSDTEVLLKGLNNEYIEFLKKTNSMFGFGYFNKLNQLITICRDRIGIKPLYFINNSEVFAFASTITPLVIFSNKQLNHENLWQFYLNRAFKAPATIFNDIFELPPSTYLEFDIVKKQASGFQKWWERKRIEELYFDETEIIENVEALLTSSIKDRLVADVPVGLFLSGGVDSSLIAALTAKQTNNLNAFTVAFKEKNYDESGYAKQVCEKYSINYNEIKVDANDFVDSIEQWIQIQDDIVADPSALLLYKIAEYASSQNYRVLLAGEGSDELFGGYNSYKYFNWSKEIYKVVGKKIPLKSAMASLVKKDSKKFHFVQNSLNDPAFYGTAMIFEPHLLSKLLKGYNADATKAFNLKAAMDLDIKDRLPNDILTRSDRSSSGTSIELRVPFLSHQLVNYSAGIAENIFMKNKTPKYLIKKLASKYLDQDLIYRKKVGFDLPIKNWISNELKEITESAINDSVQKEFIDINIINQCYHLHINKGFDYSSKLWAFLCLELSFKYLSSVR
jgi:asparagine synthase (glutamine-hydrolysing)